jgi:hypothetical protein
MILYQSKGDDISTTILAKINSNGDLVVEGADIGPKVKELKQSFDYEYGLTIRAKDKATLVTFLQNQDNKVNSDDDLLSWLKQNYGHNQGFSELMNFCKEIEVPFESFFWP